MDEELEWLKLPHALQALFFERVEEEASSLLEVIEKLDSCLSSAEDFLKEFFEPYSETGRNYRIGAVDGSRSPRLSERLGVRYGVYAAGAVIIEGGRRVDERYYAGQFKRKQAFSGEASKYFLELLSEHAERKLALEILSEVDFLLIDGSFFGFIYPALRMKKQKLFGEREEALFREIYEMTEELVKSKKVIGVIKRSHTRAIGGFLAANGIDISCSKELASVIDKLILSATMPPKTIFRYDRLVGEESVTVYTEAARTFLRSGSSEGLIEVARKKAYEPFKRLGLDAKIFGMMRRTQVKAFAWAPVCELEHPSIDFDELKGLIGSRNFFSEATGLPLAIDVVDSLVNLGSRFTEEYVDELEARLLEKLSRKKPEVVRWFFQLLNPQKEF